jgi:hypothetical protein
VTTRRTTRDEKETCTLDKAEISEGIHGICNNHFMGCNNDERCNEDRENEDELH